MCPLSRVSALVLCGLIESLQFHSHFRPTEVVIFPLTQTRIEQANCVLRYPLEEGHNRRREYCPRESRQNTFHGDAEERLRWNVVEWRKAMGTPRSASPSFPTARDARADICPPGRISGTSSGRGPRCAHSADVSASVGHGLEA